MKEKRARDIDAIEEYEDIRQVPLEPGRAGGPGKDRPVGDSYMGGRPGRSPVSHRKPAKGRKGSSGHARGSDHAQGFGHARGSDHAQGSGHARSSDHICGSGGQNGGRRGFPAAAFLLALVLGIGAGLGGGYYLWGWERPYMVDLKAVEMPEWVKQDFIRKNIFSRPDVGRQRVDKIVIHYVANPGTTAKNNRDYFDGLADQDPQKEGSSSSSHFVVGLEGEVIQCIPINEIAYANAPLNTTTVSIEACHPDESGKFNDVTYDSVVKLTAWLCRQMKLSSKDVIRHYDVSGKICPIYFVDHEDAWEQFRKDVQAAIKDVDAAG